MDFKRAGFKKCAIKNIQFKSMDENHRIFLKLISNTALYRH
ncbi:hypothetical protein HMPREF1982_00988 [Clostridiales bacterium oral taxon 876 str. F0540]|nr:hypothetical protein HMPREF1982_00988 [Clostridiales bacterium oral taxon 876 str. F0540]